MRLIGWLVGCLLGCHLLTNPQNLFPTIFMSTKTTRVKQQPAPLRGITVSSCRRIVANHASCGGCPRLPCGVMATLGNEAAENPHDGVGQWCRRFRIPAPLYTRGREGVGMLIVMVKDGNTGGEEPRNNAWSWVRSVFPFAPDVMEWRSVKGSGQRSG